MSVVDAKRIVIKVGTSTLTYANGKPNFRNFDALTRVISDLKNSGKEIALVTSGAISVGANHMNLAERPTDVKGKQAAAAVGQCELMFMYDKFFSEYGQIIAQILLTRDVVEHEERKQNVINTFHELLRLGVTPIVNENDSVSIEELVFGDNDNLSAIVATLINADLLIIITDIDGLYDKNPAEHDDAKLIPYVEEITPEMMNAAGGSGTNGGTGGMVTKLEAATHAAAAGIDTAIVSGENLKNIYDLLDGKPVGTIFKGK